MRWLRKHPWIALLVLGAVLTALGVYRDEVATLFRKAILLCEECVGIG